MNNRLIASDRSYEVLQARRLRGEIGACALDSRNQRLHPLPSQLVVREAFIADRKAIVDSYQGGLSYAPQTAWHGYHVVLDRE